MAKKILPILNLWSVLFATVLGGGFNAQALTWYWSNPMPHGNNIAGIAYYNGLTIEVADFGQLYTSDDLQLWIPRPTGTANSLQAITTFGSGVIVTGESGTVLWSTNGVDYNYTNLETTDWLVSVAASSNLLVAVGDNAAIYTSSDGTNWARQATPPGVGENWLQGVAYGGGTFVAVGDSGYVATSPNGTNWTERSTIAAGDLTSVNWINTPGGTGVLTEAGFLAVSDAGEAIVSTNAGASWAFEANYSTTTNVLFTSGGNADSRLIAGDSQMNLERIVANHAVWPNQIGSAAGTALSWTYYCSLWETNLTNQYLVAGETGMLLSGTQAETNYTWAQLENSDRSWLWQVTTNAGLYVAVGANASIMTSGDGITWETEAIPYTNGISASNTVFFGVGGTSNLLVAAGNDGAVMLSTNQFVQVITTNSDGSFTTNLVSTIGIVWNPVVSPTTNDLQGIAPFGSDYYLCGGGGTILQSSTGETWTKLTSSTTAYLSGLAASSSNLVAVGDLGTILTSPNGINWTARTSGTTNWIFRVRYLDGIWIAVGESGTILTSTTGATWTAEDSGTTNWLNDVIMVSNAFYVVGNYGTVLASTNAVTWTNVPIITGESLYGAATQSGQLLVVGDSGVILRSQVIPPVTQLQFLDFQYATNAVLFLVAATNAAVDLTFTLDTSTNLPNWKTGPQLNLTSGPLFFYETLASNAPPRQYYRATLVQ